MDPFKEMMIAFGKLPFIPLQEGEDPLHRYDGVPYVKLFTVEALEAMKTFEVRSDDVYVITYPKAGTTWTQEIVSMVMNGANEEQLSKTHLFFRFPFLEMTWAHHFSQVDQVPCVYKFLDKVPSPRIIKTHLSKDHLPPQLFSKKPKVIYVARNPKDVAVSFFHMHNSGKALPIYAGWGDFITDFQKGAVHCGSWYDHTLAWWKERNEENVLFLKYEEMKRDLRGAVVQIAEFLNCQLSDEAIDITTRHCSFSNMKENQFANPDYLFPKSDDKPDDAEIKPATTSPSFMRKGTVGDWKNYFTIAQDEAFDKEYNAIMTGTGLQFDFDLEW